MIELGEKRPVALTIIYLLQESGFSLDIEEATGLKQPEVSSALRILKDRGWVEQEAEHVGVGRPKMKSKLLVNAEEIVDYITRDGHSRIEEIETNIEQFKELILG